jgi:dolichol-phosphate mannosyltransferase
MPDTIIIIPVWNERDNIAPLIGQITALDIRPRPTMLFVDNRSTDGTAELLSHLSSAGYCKYVDQNDSQYKGLGGAIHCGLTIADKDRFDYAVVMEGDLQHDPRHIPAMLQRASENNIVIASKAGSSWQNGVFRQMVSVAATSFARTVLGLKKITDVTSCYRLYDRDAIRLIVKSRDYPSDYSYMAWALWKCRGLKISEIAQTPRPRIYGETKINMMRQPVEYVKTVLKIRARGRL